MCYGVSRLTDSTFRSMSMCFDGMNDVIVMLDFVFCVCEEEVSIVEVIEIYIKTNTAFYDR